jgi:predicted dehydrogenase
MDQNENNNDNKLNRRSILKALAGIPFLGVFAYEAMRSLSYESNVDRKNLIIKELGLENKPVTKLASKASSVQKGDTLRIGIIGFGNRARALVRGLGFLHPSDAEARRKRGNLGAWMMQENLNVELAGVCDVFDLNAEYGLETAKNGLRVNGNPGSNYPVKRYRTYQELLNDKNIDAVVVATPDHHHARITTDAIKAGKHVYCEKSISLTEEDLLEVYNAVKNSDKVFQLGHQITQNAVFQQAKEVINKNILGKISLIETTTNRNTASGAWIRHLDNNGNPKPGDLSMIDWDQWLGNTPKVPFSKDRFYNWTKYFDYDTGMLGQLFTHEYDAINQLLSIGIPKSVVASGGIYYWKDNRDIPDVFNSVFEYPDKELAMTYSASLSSSRPRGRVIMGHDASMELGSDLKITADANSTRFKKQIKDGLINTSGPMLTIAPGSDDVDATSGATEKYYASRGLTDTYINGKQVDTTHLHIKEWVDCIRYGGETSCNIEKAFEEGVTVLMAHKSYVEKRRVEWDPLRRKIV